MKVPSIEEYIKQEQENQSQLRDQFNNSTGPIKYFYKRAVEESQEVLSPHIQRIRDVKIDELLS